MAVEGGGDLLLRQPEAAGVDRQALQIPLEERGPVLGRGADIAGYDRPDARPDLEEALCRQCGHDLVGRVGIDAQALAEGAHRRK